MASLSSNTQPVTTLGRQLQEFHLRRVWLGRWGNLLLAGLCLVSAVFVLLYAGYQAYQYYFRFGPAILWKTVEIPIILELLFLVIGLAAARAAYVNWKRKAVLFENGFTYQDFKGIQVWRWMDIQSYRYMVYRNYAAFLHTGDTHQCLLFHNGGTTLKLDDELGHVDQLVSKIRESVFPRLYTQSIRQFQDGKPLEFGPIAISLAKGVVYRKKSAALEALDSFRTTRGILQITFNSKRETLRLPAAQIPNLDILLAILAEIKSRNLYPIVPAARSYPG